MRKLLFYVCIASGAAGCSDSLGPADISGRWVFSSRVVGSGLNLTMVDTYGAITGAGAQFIEAGQTREFALTGTSNGRTVTLQLDFDAGGTGHFAGRLTDASHLSGTLTEPSGFSSEITLQPLNGP